MSQITKKSPIPVSKRPSELVRDYIEQEFLRSDMPTNSRLPTIHEFAAFLNVSPSTVRSVFKKLSTEGKLETLPGKGTFLKRQMAEVASDSYNCIGVNIPIHKNIGSGWGDSIFLGIMKKALKANIMIMTLNTTRKNKTDIRKAICRMDGVIAFPKNHTQEHDLDHACLERKIPLIHINPTYLHATGNFVSNDYFKFAYHLALAWRETGRRRVVLVIGSPVNQSVSAAQIVAAFQLAYVGCPDARVDILEKAPFTVDASEEKEHYREVGRRFITDYLTKHGEGGVDAVYGFGDWTAEGVVQGLLEAKRKIPEEVSVVGGTGMDVVHFDFGSLVTMKQPMKKVGEAAMDMLLWRIQNQGIDVPGVYLMPELGKGATIRPEERKAFQQLLTMEKLLV